MEDGDVVYNMGDDIMEEMEKKKVRYVMTIIIALGRNMKWITTLTLCTIPLNKILYVKIYMDI